MAKCSLLHLPTTLLAFLAITHLSQALECYAAAYGLIGANGWSVCPGTATKPGGALSCCGDVNACGSDGLCRGTNSSGGYSWYQAGCTDSTFDDPVCRNSCQSYSSTFVEWLTSEQKWMCCGNGGCNGTITGDTFSADSPQAWKQITSASSSSATTTATSSSSTSTTAPITTTLQPSSASSSPSSPAAASDKSQNSGGLSTGAKAGIGVAVAVSVLALIAALIAIMMLRRNRSKTAAAETAYEKRVDDEQERRGTIGTIPPSYEQVIEIGDGQPARELPGNPLHEMPASVGKGMMRPGM